MERILRDTVKRVKFAFALRQFGGDQSGVLVMQALRDVDLDHDGETPEQLREKANQLLLAMETELFPAERESLIALYSQNWRQRRAAADFLPIYFRPYLDGVVKNPHSVDKLVARHFIAERDRDHGWSLAELAGELREDRDALREAADRIAIEADKLVSVALENLSHALARNTASA